MEQSIPVTLYESKPATEWLFGGPVRKVSPKWAHGALQFSFASLLHSWAVGRGRIATEWRCWLKPTGEAERYLVPDVAYVSFDRFELDESGELRVAPNVAVEILSPDDRPRLVEHKIDVYLRAGTSLVIVVDPKLRTIRCFDGRVERTFSSADRFEHPALPDFAFEITAFFAEIDEH